MRTKPVTNQNPWFVVGETFGLRVKDMLNPVQADRRVGISGFGAREVPPRSGVRGPRARAEFCATCLKLRPHRLLLQPVDCGPERPWDPGP